MSPATNSSTRIHAALAAFLLAAQGCVAVVGMATAVMPRIVLPGVTRYEVVYSVAAYLTPISFFTWVYRAHRNVAARLGALSPWTPGLSVFAFMIPLLNVYTAYCAIEMLWLTSAGGGPDPDWRQQPAPRLLLAWWLSLLVVAIVPLLALCGFASGAWGLHVFQKSQIASDCFTVLAAFGCAYLVLAISARQARLMGR